MNRPQVSCLGGEEGWRGRLEGGREDGGNGEEGLEGRREGEVMPEQNLLYKAVTIQWTIVTIFYQNMQKMYAVILVSNRYHNQQYFDTSEFILIRYHCGTLL